MIGAKCVKRSTGGDRGVALITALLYTSLASMFAVSLVASQQLEIRRTENLLDGDRAYLFAMGVESWVEQIMLRDDPAKDSLDEDWALVLPPIEVEGGKVAGFITDMQGRFNLNDLVVDGERSENDVKRFQRLLDSLGLQPEVATAVVDWLDSNGEPSFPGGAEDDEYMAFEAPYRAANRLMVSPSELLLVKGFTQEIYEQLEPYICTLPERTPINVNTASAPVLASLHDAISLGDAEAMVEQREDANWDSVADFLNQEIFKDQEPPLTEEAISVNSSYFLLDASTTFGNRGKVRLFSLLARKNGVVGIVMRAEGVL